MKKKTGNVMENLRAEIEYRLRRLCGRPSPLKRFVAILIMGGVLAAANIYLVISSIYHIGKRDAETEFMELQHIESLKLQSDSIRLMENGKLRMENSNIKNQNEYEYE